MLQIQPFFANREMFETLSQQENLNYEIMELSMGYLSESDTEGALTWYKNSNRATSLHGAFMDNNPASSEMGIALFSKEVCRTSCRYAQKAGAKNVVFHSSCFPNLRGYYLEGWANKCAEFYSELSRSFDINIYIENSFDLDTTPILELMKRTDSSHIGVCLDVGHAVLSRISIEKWFDDLYDRIGYIHLSDNMGEFDDHLPLGTGTVDLKKISKLCESFPQSTPVTIEVSRPSQISQSLEYMKQNELFKNLR